jgi:phosphoribosyl 1,2-cyclic phosphodiesterase
MPDSQMSLDLCILASGSAGNCSVIRTPAGVFLVDCGLPPKVVAARLRGTGVDLTDITAVCLTHLDRDHFSPFFAGWIGRTGATIFCAADSANEVKTVEPRANVVPFGTGPFEVLPGVGVTATRVAHDQTGSHAFRFGHAGASIGYATDLGHVPPRLIGKFCGVDVLAIEANYDPAMQQASPRPVFLKQRITGGRGHLSNNQALAAVIDLLDRCRCESKPPPRQIVLLHRSQQCNCPRIVQRTFAGEPRLVGRVILSDQHRRTEWINAGAPAPSIGEQLVLSFG